MKIVTLSFEMLNISLAFNHTTKTKLYSVFKTFKQHIRKISFEYDSLIGVPCSLSCKHQQASNISIFSCHLFTKNLYLILFYFIRTINSHTSVTKRYYHLLHNYVLPRISDYNIHDHVATKRKVLKNTC